MERLVEAVPDADYQVLQNFLTHSSWAGKNSPRRSQLAGKARRILEINAQRISLLIVKVEQSKRALNWRRFLVCTSTAGVHLAAATDRQRLCEANQSSIRIHVCPKSEMCSA